jgi:hypothetical protein
MDALGSFLQIYVCICLYYFQRLFSEFGDEYVGKNFIIYCIWKNSPEYAIWKTYESEYEYKCRPTRFLKAS